jgi:hypothetical protein
LEEWCRLKHEKNDGNEPMTRSIRVTRTFGQSVSDGTQLAGDDSTAIRGGGGVA